MDVRERFIESIEYLRKLGFFEEYSNLTSEEIFERLKEKSIIQIEKEDWSKESDFEIDRFVAIFDEKRVWGGEFDYPPNPGVGLKFLNGLANISRGVFQPMNAREEYRLEEDETKPFRFWTGWCRVYFTYRREERMLEFFWNEKNRWQFGHALNDLNWMIKHTGYRYYQIRHPDMYLFVVLKPEEARKLRNERGWVLESVW